VSVRDPAKTAALVAQVEQASAAVFSTTDKARDKIALELLAEDLALARDNRALRKKIALWVGSGLAAEIVLLFVLVVAQGLGAIPFYDRGFELERWTFSIFTTAVLLQTFGLARLVVRNLFPDGERREPKAAAAYKVRR